MDPIFTQESEMEDLRRRCRDLQREVESLRAGKRNRLSIAADVHRSLLPRPVRHDNIWVDVRYIPVEDVGGDYCQVRFPDQHTCYISVCDVMGHGTGSALLATRISSEVRYSIMYRREPRDILSSLEQFMSEYFSEAGLFLTFIVARIDLERREITWSGAGHPSSLIIRPQSGDVLHLASHNGIIGADLLKSHPPQQETQSLQAGDRLFFFTDGMFEIENASETQLGLDGFAKLAKSTMNHDLFEAADTILEVIHEYQSGPDTDDRTLVVAEIR